MKYSKCTCKTKVHTADLIELDGLQGEEFKRSLAEIIGSWCMFDSESKFGRQYKKLESAETGKQMYHYSCMGDDWTFTATVICCDYEDEINADFLPYFVLDPVDIVVIKARISEFLGMERIREHFPADMAERISERKAKGCSVWGATYSELETGIPALVREDLETAVNDIFTKYQTALNILDGGIEPGLAVELSDKLDTITDTIKAVLTTQFEYTLDRQGHKLVRVLPS